MQSLGINKIAVFIPFVLVLLMHSTLAFANANGIPAKNISLALFEFVIILSVLFNLQFQLRRKILICLTLISSYAFARSFILNDFDVKVARDLLIAILFYEFGLRKSNAKTTDKILLSLGGLVLVVAIWERNYPYTYAEILQPLEYYISRGVTTESTREFMELGVNVNGLRPEAIGRFWFDGVLSDLRSSSLFLEPVSVGNLGGIIFMWFSLRDESVSIKLLGCLVGFLLAILSDSRAFSIVIFATGSIWLLLRANQSLTVFVRHKWTLFCLPFIPIFLIAINIGNEYSADNFMGRVILSAVIFDRITLLGLLGLNPSADYAYDSGYTYFLLSYGLVGIFGAWTAFNLGASRPSQIGFKFVISVWLCVLLIGSNSVTSAKVSSFLFFALGSLANHNQQRPAHNFGETRSAVLSQPKSKRRISSES